MLYEKTINNAWNTLSLWWFDELDGRRPNQLYNNLQEHFETIRYIAKINKPFEANVAHHFAFRGCDDVTYIVSEVLCAKLAKKLGVRYFIVQNMLNTPRSTWGVQDLAKSRAMLDIIKELQDDNFRIILQTRAGLNYFKPDLDEARIQLAAVTAMMDDIDPKNDYSPEIIHVVSFSEAMFLATPDILNESIKITRYALREYRNNKWELGAIVKAEDEIAKRKHSLEQSARRIIFEMEKNIPDLYTPEGFYIAFVSGWLPVPELWSDSDEFLMAKKWNTMTSNGSTYLADNGIIMSDDTRINKCVSNMPQAKHYLNSNRKHSL